MKEIENNMYYQTGIKTSRNEDSVYAMKYASQQMMIDKLQKENQQLKKQLQKKEDIINKIEDYLIKNNLFSYKYDEEELYEIVTDNKGDENNGL